MKHILLSENESQRLASILRLYQAKLYDDVLPFWTSHSADERFGGYFTCLDRQGTVFDTDKFVWLQAREAWMFSHLYNRVLKRDEWLRFAKHGADFLIKHAANAEGDHYFGLSRDGKPVTAPYNIYTDCFAAMAYAEYAQAAGSDSIMSRAFQTYENIQSRKDNPKGRYEKRIANNRSFRAFSFPMMQLNMAQVFKRSSDDERFEHAITDATEEICAYHISREYEVVYERVAVDSDSLGTMESRLLCPGHACEVIWFLAKSAEERRDESLIELLKNALVWTLERGWDTSHGGIFYYQDVQGLPTDKLESDMKLWWVHAEAAYAALFLFSLTGDRTLYNWFLKIHEWSWTHFNDDEFGEWYGYLYHDGTLAKTLKGGKWKGCFHLPRFLLESVQTLKGLTDIRPS
jgi:N-acylglucosamine 2-epimerase